VLQTTLASTPAVGDAVLSAEGSRPARQSSPPDARIETPAVALPEYWTRNSEDARAQSETVVVSPDVRETIQALFEGTWSNVRTRDRAGSEKVSKLEVVQVLRNQNVKLWARYQQKRQALATSLSQGVEFQPYETRTRRFAQQHDGAGRLLASKQLWEGANEFLLFHGSCPSAMDSICEGNFKESFAGAAGLYGPGFYFAEACSKADEYSSDDKEGIYKGLYAMLVCRVTCGACLYNSEVRPDTESLLKKVAPRGPYHSVLGDREKARGTYREFVVYDKDQVYPEYVVLYRRATA